MSIDQSTTWTSLGRVNLLRNALKCDIISVTLMKEFQHETIIRLFYSVYY